MSNSNSESVHEWPVCQGQLDDEFHRLPELTENSEIKYMACSGEKLLIKNVQCYKLYCP